MHGAASVDAQPQQFALAEPVEGEAADLTQVSAFGAELVDHAVAAIHHVQVAGRGVEFFTGLAGERRGVLYASVIDRDRRGTAVQRGERERSAGVAAPSVRSSRARRSRAGLPFASNLYTVSVPMSATYTSPVASSTAIPFGFETASVAGAFEAAVSGCASPASAGDVRLAERCQRRATAAATRAYV